MRLDFSQWNLTTDDDRTTLKIISEKNVREKEGGEENYDIKFIFTNKDDYNNFLIFVKNIVNENNIVEMNPILILMGITSHMFEEIDRFILKEKENGLGFKYINSDFIFKFKSLKENNKKEYHSFVDDVSSDNYEYKEDEMKEEVFVKKFPVKKIKNYTIPITKISYYHHRPYYPSGDVKHEMYTPMSKRTESKSGSYDNVSKRLF